MREDYIRCRSNCKKDLSPRPIGKRGSQIHRPLPPPSPRGREPNPRNNYELFIGDDVISSPLFGGPPYLQAGLGAILWPL